MKKMYQIVLASILLFSLFLAGCGTNNDISSGDSTESAGITAGTYTATEKGLGDIKATVEVDKEGKIIDLQIDASQESEEFGIEAAQKLQEEILASQTVQVDTVSGATVTSKAVIAAVTKALQQAGVNTDEMKKVAKTGTDEETTVDVVVIGAGTAGTGASIAAAEAGAKVLILEKTGQVGGMATTGMGLFATESSLQKELGQDVTSEWLYNYLEEYNHYRGNGPLMKAIIDKSGDTIDWLMNNGIGLRLSLGINQKMHADSPKTYHMWTNSKEDFPKAYDMIQEKYDAKLMLNTTGEELIQDSNGNVTGVIATKEDGGKLTVHAKSVIISAGGFGGDADMLKEKSGLNEYNYFGIANQGEGVKMAWKAGADELGDGIVQIHLGDLAGSKSIFDRYIDNTVSQVKDVPLLWVNKEGTRFTNESIVYDNVLWGNAAYSAGGEYFTIVDQGSIDQFAQNGINMTGAYQMNGDGLMHMGGGNSIDITIDPLPTLQEDLDKLIAEDVVYKADTIEELAKLTGMNEAKLASSIETYNKAVADGKDTTFYKEPEYLQYNVQKGPYYAIRVKASVYGSIGGVRINEDIQAVKADGQPIPGLYVAGSDAGGMYDNTYPDVEGLTMGFAMNSGRIAGENAAAHALNK
ncbi:FAD-binding protein [Bacillus tuaregi]|uniref:FAD-binding protein n=1 Tax=Bacillus tuaregi TaxID=1816695 RepID=UPI0008F803F0|nr:FAD-binding protein [Bacillus tuaregi]